MQPDRHKFILSFSGIDGAGKSTQIDLLHTSLSEAGLRVNILTFWDDVVVLRRFREDASTMVFGGDAGVGTPLHPVNRRDKNVRAWYTTALRLVLYVLDGIRLNRVLKRTLTQDADVVIFDRYIYDEFANLSADHWFTRLYTTLLLKLVARPHAAYLLDADPEAARARKPEYPLDFLRKNRNAYLALSARAGMTVIPPGEPAAAHQEIVNHLHLLAGEDYGNPKPFPIKDVHAGP